MTEEFIALGGFIILVVGAAAGAWWRVEGRVAQAKTELLDAIKANKETADTKIQANAAHIQLVQQQLQEHKTHVAEHYVSRAGHRETMETITSLIKGLVSDIRGLRDRFDKFIDRKGGRGDL